MYLPYCGKYPKLLSTLWNYQCFFHKIIHIVNHLEYFFHISSIEPKDLRGLPQILPQSAKFLPRACSRRSRNIPSLLRESDSVMTKVASDNLHETEGAGNISKLRNEIKMVEASRWYNGKRHDGKKVGDGDKKWCENCNSTTHDTVQCWSNKTCTICGKKAI